MAMTNQNPEKPTVLVVDDEEYIRDLVRTALSFSGFEVAVAADGVTALNEIQRLRPSLVILDVNMPGFDGFEVVRRLRDAGDDTPVIFLTARDSAEDRVSGFTKGGDDYVTKPFSLEELVARVEAVLRRTAPAEPQAAQTLTFSDLEMDEKAHRVSRSGRPLDLAPTEFNLLRYFMANPEQVLSKQQILDHVWHYDFEGDPNVVETYVSYLRKKTEALGPRLIQTVRGFGYVLRDEP
ncbi:MAG: response regulator transcription factor [Acidimicrobiia bacterium]|jgi:two-component system OmpR family response regulator|nr:response regulator transcription factor [Acidimicrobiia bacterium]MBT8214235.1 response regulator transcription factor [Acidimicrobiia bacterium]NNL69164.1 response regulator transcription factor [Acidimicrobiia bacterium]RZV45450.1 MAG: response regulator transcription factor [Acidimicrobiia bacterium]